MSDEDMKSGDKWLTGSSRGLCKASSTIAEYARSLSKSKKALSFADYMTIDQHLSEMNTKVLHLCDRVEELSTLTAENERLREVVDGIPSTIDDVQCNMHRRLYHNAGLGWVTLDSIEKNLDGEMEWNYRAEDGRMTTPEWCYSSKEAKEAADGNS